MKIVINKKRKNYNKPTLQSPFEEIKTFKTPISSTHTKQLHLHDTPNRTPTGSYKLTTVHKAPKKKEKMRTTTPYKNSPKLAHRHNPKEDFNGTPKPDNMKKLYHPYQDYVKKCEFMRPKRKRTK